MLIYFPLLIIIIIFGVSFRLHFVTDFKTMVAFVGTTHVRIFEKRFDHVHADLWAFGHRKRKSTRVIFSNAAPFEIFETYNYEHILIVYDVVHIPLFFDTDTVVQYKLENKTVATLWPRLATLPSSYKDKYDGKMDTIQL